MVTTTHASAPDAAGFSERHGSLGGKSPRGIGSGRVPAARRVGVLRQRSSARSQHRSLPVRGTVCCLSLNPQSMIVIQGCRSRSAGLGRPRPLERGTRCAGTAHGRGKTGAAIHRGEFLPCDPCRSDNHRRISAPGMCCTHASLLAAGASAARVRAETVFRLAEVGLGPDKAGSASAAAQCA